MWRGFSKVVREVLQIGAHGGGSYRPDLHYMRGPGPKWHAKYGRVPTKASPTEAPSSPSLHDIAERRA